MYVSHFGLQQAPFSIAPDPRYLYMSERHREALAHLLFGVGGGGGFVLLTGEIGAGKTTVCRCFLEQVPEGCQVAYIFNPKLSVIELLQSVCDEFGIAVGASASDPSSPASVKTYIDLLNRHLLAAHALGRHCVLVIDEAQNLSAEVLEQLRLLTNLETSSRKLLQIMLIGQPELRTMLAEPGLEQLAQRVIARYHLGALTAPETAAYLAHRLAVAGLVGALPFDTAALRRIHQRSAGVPRRINLLADRALLGAYGQGQRQVGRRIVERAAREVFDSTGPASRRAGFAARAGVAAGLPAWALLAAGCVGGALLAGVVLHGGRGGAVAVTAPAGPLLGGAASVAAALSPGQPATSAALPSGPASAAAAGASPAGMAAGASSASAAATGSSPGAADTAPAEVITGLLALPQDEQPGWRALAALWGVDASLLAGPDACQALRKRQLRCYRSTASTLDQLQQLDRPGLLLLHLPNGPPRVARLVALDPQRVVLAAHGPGADPQSRAQTLVMPRAELARWWRGEYSTLWRPPAGYAEVLQPGASGPAVDGLARSLAVFYRDPAPPGGQALAGDLAARLAGFQVAQSLRPDGLAGPTTFMHLNRATGVAEPRLRAGPLER